MNSIDTNGQRPIVGPTTTPTDTPVAPADAPASTSRQMPVGFAPTAGNASGLLQNFILPKTTLDALGLLRPSNQGDGEALVSQAFLTSERLASENESNEASAISASAATQAGILGAFQLRLTTLNSINRTARATIAANDGQLNSIDADIGQVLQELDTLEDQQQSITDQINALEVTDENAGQIRDLRAQLAIVNGQMGGLNTTLNALENDQDRLRAENAGLTNEINQRQQTIDGQTRLIALIGAALERLVAATDGVNQTVEGAQEQKVIATGEVIMEDILSDLQNIFEIDLEDAGLETLISETQLDDREVKNAVTLSFGLVGSFFESLGLFLQLANLAELDLDSAAFGNNKSQRMQISV